MLAVKWFMFLWLSTCQFYFFAISKKKNEKKKPTNPTTTPFLWDCSSLQIYIFPSLRHSFPLVPCLHSGWDHLPQTQPIHLSPPLGFPSLASSYAGTPSEVSWALPWPSSHSAFCSLRQLHLTPPKHYLTAERGLLLQTTKRARLSSSTTVVSHSPFSTLTSQLSLVRVLFVPSIDKYRFYWPWL